MMRIEQTSRHLKTTPGGTTEFRKSRRLWRVIKEEKTGAHL